MKTNYRLYLDIRNSFYLQCKYFGFAPPRREYKAERKEMKWKIEKKTNDLTVFIAIRG